LVNNGKKVTFRGFGGYTKDEARNELSRIRLEKLNEKRGLKRPGNGEPIPFGDFAKEFLELYAKQNKKSWTRDETSLNSLLPFLKGETLQSIGPEKVERYKAKRRAEVEPSTVNREIACLKTIFNKAVEWGKIEKNPLQLVKKFKEASGRERILNIEEARRLIECASPSIRLVLIVALNTGMRRNEILSLKWRDVDFVKGFILIDNSKSGKSRKIPMNATVFDILHDLPHTSEYVFFNPKTKTHIKDIKTAFSGACRRAEIKGLRLHDLRHTALSKMVEAGIDLVTVSKIAGHSSIQMTMRYSHPTPENMRKAVNCLGEMFNPPYQKVDLNAISQSVSPSIN
jgi:integrase